MVFVCACVFCKRTIFFCAKGGGGVVFTQGLHVLRRDVFLWCVCWCDFHELPLGGA